MPSRGMSTAAASIHAASSSSNAPSSGAAPMAGSIAGPRGSLASPNGLCEWNGRCVFPVVFPLSGSETPCACPVLEMYSDPFIWKTPPQQMFIVLSPLSPMGGILVKISSMQLLETACGTPGECQQGACSLLRNWHFFPP